jgi:hypothetical protein
VLYRGNRTPDRTLASARPVSAGRDDTNRVLRCGDDNRRVGSERGRPRRWRLLRGLFRDAFSQLAAQIARDLRARNDWSAVYTGCDAGLLQYAFSYEPLDGQVAQALRAALKLGPTAAAPAGAAVVASRLALYAALAKAGVTLPAGEPRPDQAPRRSFLPGEHEGFAISRAAS